MIVTASGILNQYFNGMAMNNKITSELPSNKPMKRKRPNAFLNKTSLPTLCILPPYIILNTDERVQDSGDPCKWSIIR